MLSCAAMTLAVAGDCSTAEISPRKAPGSLIITSQLPIDRWYEIVGNPTLADAILDRIIHNAHRIELRGESLRKPRAGG